MQITPNPEKLPTIAGNSTITAEKRKRGRPRKNPIPPEKLNIPKSERKRKTPRGEIIEGKLRKEKEREFIHPSSIESNTPRAPMPERTQSIYNSHQDKRYIPEETVQSVLKRIRNGETLKDISHTEKIGLSTLYDWIEDNTHNAGTLYTHARERRADRLAEEIQRIADEADQSSSAAVNKARLQTDVRKWILAHIAPEKYGDNQRVEIETKGTLPLVGVAAIAEVQKIRQMLNITPTAEPPKLDNAAIIEAEEVKEG